MKQCIDLGWWKRTLILLYMFFPHMNCPDVWCQMFALGTVSYFKVLLIHQTTAAKYTVNVALTNMHTFLSHFPSLSIGKRREAILLE